jgi:hypothetical protein
MYMRNWNGKAVALVNTVASNKTKYTKGGYSRAVLARRLQRIIGCPSTRTFLWIVNDNLLPNCPITRKDILAVEHIFGPDVGSLKGKTVRRGAPHVDICTFDIPASLISQYHEVVLAADVMFVNRIPFFVTISRDIKFGKTKVLPNQKSPALKSAMTHVLSIYRKRGFIVTTIAQGEHFFLSLATGRVPNRNRWKALPMSAEVIDRVHVLARSNSSPLGLTFLDRAGVALLDADLTAAPDDDSDDKDYDPATDSDVADDDDDDGDDTSVDSDDDTNNDDNGADDDDGHDAASDPPPAPATNFLAMTDELAGVPELEPAHDAPIA